MPARPWPRRRGAGRRQRGRRRAPGGPGGPAQRGQVDAVQPPGGRRACRRPRPAGHHPGQHRHRGRDTRRHGCASSTPPACVGSHAPNGAPSTSRCSGRSRHSTGRTSPCLVIDATAGITHQDQRLAERVGAAGLPDGRRAQQVGAAARRGTPLGPGRRGRPPRLPRRSSGAQDQRPFGPGCPPHPPRRDGGRGGVPHPHSHRRAQPGHARHPGRPSAGRGARSATPCRGRPTRPPSPCSPTAVSSRPISATWSAGCASGSISARRRSSCGCGRTGRPASGGPVHPKGRGVRS